MKDLRCPLCESENIRHLRNGQGEGYEYCDEEDELYVALGNDFFDGSVSQFVCENNHSFYISHIEAGFVPTEYTPI
jgi:hypothetical protein